jgi:tetratricopeptide (TPR) repeat protein
LGVFYVALAIAPLPAPGESTVVESAQAREMRTATEFIAAGQWAEALTPMQSLSDTYPENHVYSARLAEIYEHLKQPAKEAAAWERFVATSPNADEACPRLPEAYRASGDLAKAIDAFGRCLRFAPDDPQMQFYAAHAAEWKDDWATAAALYQQAATSDPKNMDVQIGLGRVALHDGRLDDARRLADQVLTVQDDADAALVAGLATMRAGQLDDARRYFERGLARSESYADLHYFMGELDARQGLTADARRQFERALALDPNRAEFKARLAEINRSGGQP